jgi:valyl-tRNA synthetase
MPFVTEALWQSLPHRGDSLMVAPWPQMSAGPLLDEPEALGEGRAEGGLATCPEAVRSFQSLQALVRAVRNARAEYKVEAGKSLASARVRVSPAALARNPRLLDELRKEKAVLALLGRLDERGLAIEVASSEDSQGQGQGSEGHSPGSSFSGSGAVQLVVEEGLEVSLPLSALVDVPKERQRLGKQQERLLKDEAALVTRLNSPGFIDRAPAAVVDEVKANIQDKRDQLRLLEASLVALATTAP